MQCLQFLSVLQFPYESLFRSEQFCLLENACREYAFLVEFFMVTGNEANDLFHQVLGKTLGLLIVSDHRLIKYCYKKLRWYT